MDNINFQNEKQAYEYVYNKIAQKSYTYFSENEIKSLLEYVTLDFLESLCLDKTIDFKNCMLNY